MGQLKKGTAHKPDRGKSGSRSGRLSLAPLSLEEALRGAAATGAPPEGPKRPHVKPAIRPKEKKGPNA
jgi:hypothetical protein